MKTKAFKSAAGVCAVICVLAVICGIGLRIYKVNTECEKPVVRVFEQGETAAVGNNYAYSVLEQTEGYEFVVQGGTVVTLTEFLDYYGESPHYLKEQRASTYEPRYVYILKVLIRNVNNQNEKGFNLMDTPLIADNVQLQVNPDLYELMYPKFGYAYAFMLRPGTEMVLYFPYTAAAGTDEYCDYDFYNNRKLYFVISWYPEEIRMRVRTLRKEYFYSTLIGRGEYPICFYDRNGQQIGETQIVLYGGSAVPPDAPEEEGYSFTGWADKDGNIVTDFTNVVSYANYTATYEKNG